MANKSQQTVTIQFQARGERELTNAIMLLDKASKSLSCFLVKFDLFIF